MHGFTSVAHAQRFLAVHGVILNLLAEARDLRRFGCVRQFLKYCGFDLCTEQSGQFRGTTHLSKRCNARLRYAFWMAGTVAIRMQQNSFRRKFEDYIRLDPQNADRRRKGYTAVAAKMARVAYAVVITGSDETRREDPFARGRRGACDLVDNARTFHLDYNALLSLVRASSSLA